MRGLNPMPPPTGAADELARFQAAFARALLAPAGAEGAHARAAFDQPGFAVYRNTVRCGCIDALALNYATVERLVGAEWMRAAAACYVDRNLPAGPLLLTYGASLADFLAAFEPAAELPYLPGVARLDRYWTEAHIAADAEPLAARRVATIAPMQLGALVLSVHPAARWAWFDDQPIYTIWRRNRPDEDVAPVEPAGADADLAWHGEGALITRPFGAVLARALTRSGCAFLDACAAGASVAQAAAAALAVDPATDLRALMAAFLEAGAFRDDGCAPP